MFKGSGGKRWVLEKRRKKIPVKNLCQNITFCSEIIVEVKGTPIKSTEELIHVLVVEIPIYRSEWHTWWERELPIFFTNLPSLCDQMVMSGMLNHEASSTNLEAWDSQQSTLIQNNSE